MTDTRRLAVVLLCCSLLAWLSGPPGRLVVAFLLLAFGPGYLLERSFPPPGRYAPFGRPALWLGLSLSSIALGYEWATALGLMLSTPVLTVLAAACGLAIVYRLWQDSSPPIATQADTRPHLARHGAWYAWGVVFLLTLWTRFTQIEGLALPAWVDSVHHALLIRVVAEQGQAPYSLQPYLPIEHLPYHWGYHVFVAAVMQLSGAALPQVMLWTGQMLNALHVLTCAALAAHLWRRPLAGIVAGIVVGLLSLMPAYYVTWGRYTQLTGLLILPALAVAWQSSLRTPSPRWHIYLPLLLGGLILFHARVLVFACCLLAVLSGRWLLARPRAALYSYVKSLLVDGALSFGLTIFWLGNIAARILLPAFDNPQELVARETYNALNESLLWGGQNRLLIAVALVAALWASMRRSQAVIILAGWLALLLMAANPWLANYFLPALGLLLLLWAWHERRATLALWGAALLPLNPLFIRFPSSWLINNDSVIISLFLPISILVGGGACLLWDWIGAIAHPAARRLARGGCVLLLLLLMLWGTWESRTVINPITVLATPADVAAIEWADQHTPTDARFLINAAGWLPVADRGVDGGWWLLPLAGRQVSTPPVIYTYGPPDYVRQVRERSRIVSGFQAGQQQQIYQLIEQEQITHIYLGANSRPLSADIFADTSKFERIYEQDGIVILAVHRHS